MIHYGILGIVATLQFGCNWCRALEDIGVVYLGSAIFKITRLTFMALFCVHLFACIYFRVKESSASSVDDVVEFYASKNIQEDVSTHRTSQFRYVIDSTKFIQNDCCMFYISLLQDLSSQYVRRI